MNGSEKLQPGERSEFFRLIDHQIKSGEAKPGQRQKALVLGLCEIAEDETGYEYPQLNDLVPVVYEDRFYPQATNYLLLQAEHSLNAFIQSLEKGRQLALEIAAEVRDEIRCEDLTHAEIIDVVTRTTDFWDYAIRIGLKHKDDSNKNF